MNSVHKIKALDQISKLSFGLYALGCQVLFSWREKMILKVGKRHSNQSSSYEFFCQHS